MAKFILIGAVVLFSVLGCVAIVKKIMPRHQVEILSKQNEDMPIVTETAIVSIPIKSNDLLANEQQQHNENIANISTQAIESDLPRPRALPKDDFPNIDRVFQLFTLGSSKLPIVETVAYSSTVPWLKGRPAWLVDYAAHFNTSRHFIARSLNGKADYFSQKISEGNRFNVFRTDKRIHFYLLVDVSQM